jgi:tetratricopeptide (TPR) repeat protein
LDLADSRLGFVWLAILVSFRDYDRALDLINTLEPAIQKSNRSAGLPAIRAEKADCGGDPEERVKAYTTYAEHMREGDHVLGQMPALIGLSRAHRDNGDAQAALEAAQEAVDLAGPRGFIRRYGEGLIERGRLRLNNGEASKALDDAELAEAQANTCGNVWVRLGAVRLQSDILKHGDYGRDVRQIQQKLNELKNTLTVPEDMRGTIEMVWWRKT